MSDAVQGRYWEDFQVGEEWTTGGRTVTEGDVANFAGLVGDYNPLHTDEEFAKRNPYRRRVAHGFLLASLASGMVNQMGIYNGTAEAFGRVHFRFLRPVFFGDTIHNRVRVSGKREAIAGTQRGIVVFEIKCINHDGKTVFVGGWEMLIKKKIRALEPK